MLIPLTRCVFLNLPAAPSASGSSSLGRSPTSRTQLSRLSRPRGILSRVLHWSRYLSRPLTAASVKMCPDPCPCQGSPVHCCNSCPLLEDCQGVSVLLIFPLVQGLGVTFLPGASTPAIWDQPPSAFPGWKPLSQTHLASPSSHFPRSFSCHLLSGQILLPLPSAVASGLSFPFPFPSL